jgi:hypothetical protein
MLLLKQGLMWGGIAMIAIAAGILIYDLRLEWQYRPARVAGTPDTVTPQAGFRASIALALLAWGPILLALSIMVATSVR